MEKTTVESITTKLYNNEPLTTEQIILVSNALKESKVVEDTTPAYNHQADDFAVAIGFDKHSTMQHFVIDEEEAGSAALKKTQHDSERVQVIEQRILNDWRSRRVFIMSYFELLHRAKNPFSGLSRLLGGGI